MENPIFVVGAAGTGGSGDHEASPLPRFDFVSVIFNSVKAGGSQAHLACGALFSRFVDWETDISASDTKHVSMTLLCRRSVQA